MDILDYITIGVFSLGVIIAGISFSYTGKSMKGFFAGGGNVPWWISGLSLFMGFFSAGTFVVWGSIAYSQGAVSITIQLTMAMAGFVVGLLVAPRWNKTGCLTAAEYITKRFGVGTQKTYTYLFMFISIFTSGAFLYPIAKIIEVSTGLPLTTSILLLGGFSVLYVTIGGLRAVVVTDVLQFLILTAAVIIVIPLSFQKIGGVSNFLANTPEGFFSFVGGEYTWVFMIAFMLYNLFFLGGNWAYVQRYTSVRTPRDAKKVGYLFGILYTISPILWMLPPMIYRVYNPGLVGIESENAYLLMCKEAMPTGLLGLMLGGMVFATASALNATLNISAGVLTNDIIKRIRPNLGEKRLMNVARLSTIGFGVLAIIVALLIPKMGGIVNVVISVAALTGVPLYLPLVWSLFSTNLNNKIIVWTTVSSLFINGLFKFITPWLFNFSFNRTEEMVVGVGVPALILIMYEIYHKVTKSAIYTPMVVREVVEQMDQAEEKEAKKSNKHSVMVIAIGAMIAGAFISILGIIGAGGTTVSLIVGGALLLIGMGIFFYSRR